ncbi:ethanolamine utilization microcompartment protein EutN [Neisseria sp. Ec49-e6-T10]|uniref:ethanolamine utilization microcompartment protein EutN n=1 Tax=Neisseria sp. Ec49-e6-T10 TaxID=3140744 RepID=UPI003EBD9B9A
MELAVVIGQVVSTVKHAGLEHDKLLVVDLINSDGKPKGDVHVASDSIGAGNGEWVLVVQGSSARRAAANNEVPIDMTIIGIVDEVVIKDKVAYHK